MDPFQLDNIVSKLREYSAPLALKLSHKPQLLEYLKKNIDAKCSKDDLVREFETVEGSALEKLYNFKYQQLFLLAARDIRGDDIQDILTQWSAVADIIVNQTYNLILDQMIIEKGKPTSPGCIIALGKLGTRELNFSSDIDLLFIYEKEGVNEKGLSDHECYTKLASKVT